MKLYKLYAVTRSDLSYGQQAAQAAHAVSAYAYDHPERHNKWYEDSTIICLVTASSEEELIALADKAEWHGVHVSRFFEPDRNNELTAIAMCGPVASSMCSQLPLACRKKVSR